MAALEFPLLSALLVIPLVGAVATYLTPQDKWARWVAMAFSLVPLALSSLLLLAFLGPDPMVTLATSADGRYLAWEEAAWIPQVNVDYRLGVDGLSILLVFLTTLLTPLALAVSWDEKKRVREFFALFLFMEVTILGVFVSLDFFLFFLFWEAGLVPMYFLIAVWGGPRRRYAAIKFFLYTQAASLLVLLGIFALYFYGGNTFDMTELIRNPATRVPAGVIQNFLFLGFLVGFGAKLPTFPLHTWLPDAHVEAPTGGSVMLAGILLKLGGYGLFRVNVQMLPDAARELAWLVALLGIVSILYGAIACIAQEDLKRLVALSSVSHMGFVTLGLAAGVSGSGGGEVNPAILTGYSGAVFQLFAHGLISAALFMLAGSLGHRLGTRNISDLGGIARTNPLTTTFLMIAFLASLGLPGLVGFVAEISIFIGTYAAFSWWVILPILSVVLTAAYYLWAAQRAVFGPLNPRWEKAPDLHRFEVVPLAILSVLFVIFGIFTFWFFQIVHTWSAATLGVG